MGNVSYGSLLQRSVPSWLTPKSRAHNALQSTYTVQHGLKVMNQPKHSNAKTTSEPSSSSDKSVNEQLKQLYRQLLGIESNHIDQNGSVQYKQLAEDAAFLEYLTTTQTLFPTIDLHTLSPDELKCFMLNTYNMLVIHGIVVLGAPSIWQLQAFYATVGYKFANDVVLTLDRIEHLVLRGHRKHPVSHKLQMSEPLPSQYKQLLLPCDPRIHMLLNCGAKSCPPIRIITPTNLENALNIGCINFIRQSTTVHVQQRRVELSQLMDWYSDDFGKNEREVLQWCLMQLQDTATHKASTKSVELRDQLQQLLSSDAPVKVKYTPYDWGLNMK